MESFQKNSTPKAMSSTTNLIISWKQRAQKFKHIGIEHVSFEYMPISHLSSFKWKVTKLKKNYVYKTTTMYQWRFMWLWTSFFKKDTKLKQCSFSTKPSTWIMAIFTNFRYSKKEWHNSYDAWITCHVRTRGLIMTKIALLNARTTTLAMGWAFHCNL
jgi:hypothetical protein